MQITIIGVGLIGGSFALALKKRKLAGCIVGCDRAAVLQGALEMGAIDEARPEPKAAIQGSNIVLLATPVGAIIDMIERIGPLLPPDALLTDTGSTKQEIVAKAREVFGADAAKRFLPGHPLAGKEQGGIEHADADLFKGATWVLTPVPQTPESACATEAREAFLDYLQRIGARASDMDPHCTTAFARSPATCRNCFRPRWRQPWWTSSATLPACSPSAGRDCAT